LSRKSLRQTVSDHLPVLAIISLSIRIALLVSDVSTTIFCARRINSSEPGWISNFWICPEKAFLLRMPASILWLALSPYARFLA